MNEMTFDILKMIVSACAALITAYVVPYLKVLEEDRKYKSFVDMVEVAVRAAEQTIKGTGKGAEKKKKVEDFVCAWLSEKGIKIESEQLNQLIECCVWQMKQGE